MKRILLVDDEERFLSATAKFLGMSGFDVQTADNGADALSKCSRDAFEVVVLDIKMPGVNGLEVLRELRRDHPEIRVLVLSGDADRETIYECMRLGAGEFISKPIDLDELMQKLRA
ncbi:response regulator [Desulfocurvus sp. DL9XJH121]